MRCPLSHTHTHTHTQIERDRDRHTEKHHFADGVTPGVKKQVYPEVTEVEKVVHTSTQSQKSVPYDIYSTAVVALTALTNINSLYRVLSQKKHKKKLRTSCCRPRMDPQLVHPFLCTHTNTHTHTHTHTHKHTHTSISHTHSPLLSTHITHTPSFLSRSAPHCPPLPPNTCIIRWG
jgi:hypothetical protein